jgi:class 3 adenylate cyclase
VERPANGATYRGFLFADLRDYTSFVERHGDAAASALLDRYRGLVRSAVAQYGGAEVKTEGDSFFVVFPSASAAVRCALNILARADAATREDPASPLRVGIGVHAGETIEGSEGYVGSAVNLAARVCAQARAGEVVVTDTVRSLTRTSLSVGFGDRGRRRLKGIAEPVQLYLVSGAAEGAAPRGASRSWAQRRYAVPVLAALLIAIGGVTALFLSVTPRPERDSATESPETPRPLRAGAFLSPDTYRTVRFQPAFSFSVGAGWHLVADDPDNFFMQRFSAPHGELGAFRTNVVYLGPCSDSATQRIEGGSDALLTWLEQHQHLEAVNPRPRSVDGVTGIQIDLTAPEEEPCPTENSGLYLIPLENPDFSVRLAAGDEMRLVVVDLPGGTVTFDIALEFGTPDDQYERFLVEAEAVLDTVEFANAGG